MFLRGLTNMLDTTWENKNIIWPDVLNETDKTAFNKQRSFIRQLTVGVSYQLF